MGRSNPPSWLRRLTGQRWRELDRVLDQALELPPEQIPALLDRFCGEDAELRAQVEALMRADAESIGVLDRTLSWPEDGSDIDPATSDRFPDPRGERIGPWRIEGEIGRGGMGTVCRATRADGHFEQTVALKLIKRGLDTDEVLARFRQERQILARLEHPGIARLVDGGATDDGRPWVAM